MYLKRRDSSLRQTVAQNDNQSQKIYTHHTSVSQRASRQIGTPVDNRVFFAGEATSQFFPATVHGAFLSGVRAAYEIMLADAKADLMKDGHGEVDTYV